MTGGLGMTQLNISLEGPLKPHHAPLLFAREGGIFDGRDLDVSWTVPSPDERSIDRLREDECDIAITRPLNLVHEFLTGEEVVGIARFLHTNSGIMYRENADFDQLSDLPEDAEFLCSDVLTDHAELLVNVMSQSKSADLPIDSFSFNQPDSDPIEQFYEGNHHALITAGVNPEGVQMEQADFHVDFWFYDDFNIPANGDLVVTTTQEMADGEPNQMQDFVHSLNDAVNVLEQDADRGRNVIKENYASILDQPGAETLLYTSFSELTSNFSQDFQTYTAWGEFFTEHGDVGGFVDVDRLIDERFIPLDSMAF
jgi:ABC-type nitrate/sulfonate/bicarbonate transport system substrate-binding protein